MMKADQLLQKAAQHMQDRAATYDKPEGERSMGKAVAAFNAITGRDLSEPEGWLLLQVLKDVRLFQRPGYHADSAEDCIAYAALKAEAKAGGVAPAPASKSGPWTDHDGSDCPVHDDALVIVEYKSGTTYGPVRAGDIEWEWGIRHGIHIKKYYRVARRG
jgi:hypothetical protein